MFSENVSLFNRNNVNAVKYNFILSNFLELFKDIRYSVLTKQEYIGKRI